MIRKTIVLVCSAGMSMMLLVSKMKEAAKEKDINAEILGVSADDLDETLASNEVDVLLLGPQVRFMKNQIEEKVAGKEIPIEMVNMHDYGMVNGKKVLQAALDLIE